MPEWYSRDVSIVSSVCDRYQRLRMSALFSMLQEASITDVELAGLTRDKTLDRGLLWVISRIKVDMTRPIRYGETVTISTIAGERAHMVFPRYYRITDREGKEVLSGSALWLLIDETARTPIHPEDYDIEIPGVKEEGMPSLPMGLRSIEMDNAASIRKVMFSDIDLNGHVNNTRYLDWIDDLFDMHFHEVTLLTSFQINYLKELSCGDQVHMYYEYNAGRYRMDGASGQETVFSALAQVKRL
ncbi:MAG: hypothetical protein IJ225_01795 [Solobacterium sp.]|nr:hypothetical protein [Solobacterium sp.]